MSDARFELALLGGRVGVILYDVEEPFATMAFAEIEREAVRLQKVFNLYDPQSELSLLNARRTMAVSDELLVVLRRALEYAAITGGAYDISKGRQFLARKRGVEHEVGCSYREILIKGNNVSLLHPDALIDLGSIAKGYIGDRLLSFIHALGIESAFVDVRGDLVIGGHELEVVDIAHPREPGSSIGSIVLENLAVATSGDYRQYVGSFERSHIVAETDLISVTAVHESLLEADAIASAVFVSGSRRFSEILALVPKAFVLAMDRGGRILKNMPPKEGLVLAFGGM